jgi:hypothetical protein
VGFGGVWTSRLHNSLSNRTRLLRFLGLTSSSKTFKLSNGKGRCSAIKGGSIELASKLSSSFSGKVRKEIGEGGNEEITCRLRNRFCVVVTQTGKTEMPRHQFPRGNGPDQPLVRVTFFSISTSLD